MFGGGAEKDDLLITALTGTDILKITSFSHGRPVDIQGVPRVKVTTSGECSLC